MLFWKPLVLAVVLVFAVVPARSDASLRGGAAARVQQCGVIDYKGGVRLAQRARAVNCRFARKWIKRILRGEGRPAGWRCDLPARRDLYVECRRGSRAFWAIEKPKPAPIPQLTRAEAQAYLRKMLGRRFGNSFRHGYAYRRSCKRESRTRFRCRVGWVIGDLSYQGRASVWRTRRGSGTALGYSWRITLTNEYCQATGGTNCTRTYRAG